ncbi:trypco2 family protein [Streptomyces sp. NPDC007971]|uniref:trypco2 family protein n=1 Tax=Streptomyces sp. NPDC007971 TaxID=3364799 RepID=UPI0036E20E2C
MIELAAMVRELKEQLNAAMAETGPGPLRFELGSVEIEATVAVDRTGGVDGKVKFWVVEAGADASLSDSRTHRITLTLHPSLVAPDGTPHRVLIAGEEADGER